MESYAEEGLRKVLEEYEATKKTALQRRDEQLRAFHANGWRPVDIQRVTGYSRETIRQALHPQVRQTVNDSRRRAPGESSRRSPADYVSYGDRRPYVVIDSLDELHGPTQGTVVLPRHLDWSGSPAYDLDRPARLASMYKTVLHEAASADDLRTWLDRQTLLQLWPTLWLPAQIRRLWEGRFPELTQAQAS